MMTSYLYNVTRDDGLIMLEDWVDYDTAKKWLNYYLTEYPPGKPYPNGLGVYKDMGYRLTYQ